MSSVYYSLNTKIYPLYATLPLIFRSKNDFGGDISVRIRITDSGTFEGTIFGSMRQLTRRHQSHRRIQVSVVFSTCPSSLGSLDSASHPSRASTCLIINTNAVFAPMRAVIGTYTPASVALGTPPQTPQKKKHIIIAHSLRQLSLQLIASQRLLHICPGG